MKGKPFELIGAGLGWGAQCHETEFGPRVLKEIGLLSSLQQQDPRIDWRCLLTPSIPHSPTLKLNYAKRLAQVQTFTERLAMEVILSQKDHIPLVIGGDHSIAMGTWSAMVKALQASMQFGLIWIDAHMDSHTPKTSPSQAIHGMPLAVLMGYGEPSLINLCIPGPKLDPAHVVLIGVRSFEEGEAQLLKRLNVKIYFMDEVKARGFPVVFAEAIHYVNQGTKGFGVSIDLDAFDPSIAPGVGTPALDGLFANEVFQALGELSQYPQFKALEIAEFNPTKDIEQKTALLTQQLILSIG